MGRPMLKYLGEIKEFYLSPLSVAEISFKWSRGRLPGVPDPGYWVEHALENFVILNLSPEAALRAGRWKWSHGDLVDRSLAALAAETGVTLVHTDMVLRNLSGFPQQWFRNVGS